MATGNEIIGSAGYVGRRLEGILTTALTVTAGIVVNMLSTAKQSGRYFWEPFGETAASSNNGVAADGDQRLIAVLLNDVDSGDLVSTTIPTGSRIFLYCPLPGDEIDNMIFMNISGTGAAQDIAIGDQLIVDNGTGKLLVAAGSDESEPFIALEAETDVTADTRIRVMFTGY
jgi:hypothetical protein